jgi:RNA polymerase sigma-70 factor (family 1)
MKSPLLLKALQLPPLHNEQDLLLQVSQGSEPAFTELFHHYRKRIYSVGCAVTHSEEMAEELVQDVFLKIWLKRNDLSAILNFESYLFVVTRNTAFDLIKRALQQRKAATGLRMQVPEATSDTDHFLLDRQYANILEEAVNRLPPQQKQVYQLIKVEGLKRNEVASRLQIQPNTVKEHLMKAMKSIRAHCVTRLDLCLITAWVTLR